MYKFVNWLLEIFFRASKLNCFVRGSRSQRSGDEILTGDIGMLRNADMAGGEFQTGDMGTPPNRASFEQL